jgi:ABC-type uncharacterized transport system auxiliary subunit
MKVSLITIALLALALCSCTTLANRRDLYSPQTVMGPYTQMLKNGVPKTKVVVVTRTETSDGKAIVPSQR